MLIPAQREDVEDSDSDVISVQQVSAERIEPAPQTRDKIAERNHVTPDQRAMAATAFLEYEEEQRQRAKAEAAAKAREHRWAEPEEHDEPSEDTDGENLFEPISAQTDEPAKPNATARAIAERAGVSKHKAEQAIAGPSFPPSDMRFRRACPALPL